MVKKHKIYLEDLLDQIKSLSEYYKLTSADGEAFELKSSEIKPFTEEMIIRLKGFLEEETFDDEEEIDDDNDDDLELFLLDGDDDLS